MPDHIEQESGAGSASSFLQQLRTDLASRRSLSLSRSLSDTAPRPNISLVSGSALAANTEYLQRHRCPPGSSMDQEAYFQNYEQLFGYDYGKQHMQPSPHAQQHQHQAHVQHQQQEPQPLWPADPRTLHMDDYRASGGMAAVSPDMESPFERYPLEFSVFDRSSVGGSHAQASANPSPSPTESTGRHERRVSSGFTPLLPRSGPYDQRVPGASGSNRAALRRAKTVSPTHASFPYTLNALSVAMPPAFPIQSISADPPENYVVEEGGMISPGYKDEERAQPLQRTVDRATPSQQPQPVDPRRQEVRFAGDMYTPRCVRGKGKMKEGWCDLCEQGGWFQLKNSAYWYHKQYLHGICNITGRPYPDPVTVKPVEGGGEALEVECGVCSDWISIGLMRDVEYGKWGASWYRHAHKVRPSIPPCDKTNGTVLLRAGQGKRQKAARRGVRGMKKDEEA